VRGYEFISKQLQIVTRKQTEAGFCINQHLNTLVSRSEMIEMLVEKDHYLQRIGHLQFTSDMVTYLVDFVHVLEQLYCIINSIVWSI